MLQLLVAPSGPYLYDPHHTLNGYGYVQLPTRAQLLALNRAVAFAIWGNNRTISENLARRIARRNGISVRQAKRFVHWRIAQHVAELSNEFGFDYVSSLNLANLVFMFLESFDPS